MVAALAAPAIAVEMSQERDERGRWSRDDSTLQLVEVGKAAAKGRRDHRGTDVWAMLDSNLHCAWTDQFAGSFAISQERNGGQAPKPA